MAAEISGPPRQACPPTSRFNEAAANGRGNRRRVGWTARTGRSFNEAAANGRGNRGWTPPRGAAFASASMRPRRMAAEIGSALAGRPAASLLQ